MKKKIYNNLNSNYIKQINILTCIAGWTESRINIQCLCLTFIEPEKIGTYHDHKDTAQSVDPMEWRLDACKTITYIFLLFGVVCNHTCNLIQFWILVVEKEWNEPRLKKGNIVHQSTKMYNHWTNLYQMGQDAS